MPYDVGNSNRKEFFLCARDNLQERKHITLALKHQYADLDVFKLDLAFPNGFNYCGEGALVEDPDYTMAARMMNIRAMLGIDIYNFYDMAIITKGERRGIELYKK